MGLDMWLEKETYVGAEHSHRAENIKNFKIEYPEKNIKRERVTRVVENVAYWRKANQIHSWFVKNVQDGLDECQRSYVSKKQLKELLELCERAIKEQRPELLEPTEGFFFGGTEINEYYWNDLKETVKMFKDILADEEHYEISYYYSSSW